MTIERKDAKAGDPNYFACSCSDKGEKECAGILDEVKKILKADDSNLLTKVVYSLDIDYNAHITNIMSDQWCGIWSETHDKVDDKSVFTTEVECDSVEVGIAATWYAYFKKFGKNRKDRVLAAELIAKAVRATNGELAWRREDLEQVFDKLSSSHTPILGGEVWAVVDEGNEKSKGREVMRLSDGRIAMGIIPDKNGNDGIYQWGYEQKTPMNILEITESSKKYALEMINKMDAENDVAPEFAKSLYYNLTWD